MNMNQNITVRDIMVRDVVSVNPDTSLVEAVQVIIKHNFDGVPVVDTDNKLAGIITEYDFISKSSAIHLPTFQIILQNLQVLHGDRSQFKKEIEEVSSLKVKDIMNNDPLTLSENATYEEVVAAFREHHRVNPIPVIDAERHVIGVVSRFDVLKPLRAYANEFSVN